MFHQYAHMKSLKSQPRESRRAKEGKTNFCFISSSWRDHFVPKPSAVPQPEPTAPSQQGGDYHRRSVQVAVPPRRGRGGNVEGESPSHKFTT